MQSNKERNASLITKTLIPAIAGWEGILPIGQLIVFFHTANGLGISWGNSDKAEERNHQFLKSIHPSFEETYIQAYVSGSFKPMQFIHPFEAYHTTTGRQDVAILPEFFKTIDELAFNYGKNGELKAETFLSFVYMYFLVIHPFVDGNGRVARNLLDYYNDKLVFNMHPTWNDTTPKFSDAAFHKEAFIMFYSSELEMSEVEYREDSSIEEVSSMQIIRKLELAKMETRLIHSLRIARSSKTIHSAAVHKMAEGIARNSSGEG